MQIILGSQSPRRREILSYFAIPFVQISSDFDEESVPFKGNAPEHTMLLSQKKSEVLAARFPTDIILTADSVVFCNGKLYNKPADEHEAKQFLLDLADRWQSVYTGVTVRRGAEVHTDFEETRLLFNPLTREQIQKFHEHNNAMDKAGGYIIERSSNLLVSKMEGCFYNVLGLPINTVQKLLLKLKLDLWDYLKTSPY
jgi:septum formation protein